MGLPHTSPVARRRPFSAWAPAAGVWTLPRQHLWRRLLVYLIAIGVAEIATMWQPVIGVLLHLVVLLALLVQATDEYGRSLPAMCLALTLAPLIRILSLTLPLVYFPQLAWYVIVSLPLFVTVLLIARLLRLTPSDVGLVVDWSPAQWAIALLGVPFGLIKYGILRPEQPLVAALDWRLLWLPALVLLVSTGFLEELIFRGLLQHVASRVLGVGFGIVYVSAIFAILHAGYRSVFDTIFVFAVGLVFAECRRRTRTIVGITLAHGVTNIMLFLICPFVLGF